MVVSKESDHASVSWQAITGKACETQCAFNAFPNLPIDGIEAVIAWDAEATSSVSA
jgi:hypothetical protein